MLRRCCSHAGRGVGVFRKGGGEGSLHVAWSIVRKPNIRRQEPFHIGSQWPETKEKPHPLTGSTPQAYKLYKYIKTHTCWLEMCDSGSLAYSEHSAVTTPLPVTHLRLFDLRSSSYEGNTFQNNALYFSLHTATQEVETRYSLRGWASFENKI